MAVLFHVSHAYIAVVITIEERFFQKGLSHIWILVYICTQNVDLDPFGKPPDLHHHIIMDLDLFGMHMHKHTFPDRRLLSSACLFTNNLEIISNVT